MYDIGRITLFCLEARLSKHTMTIYSKLFGPPGYACPLSTARRADQQVIR